MAPKKLDHFIHYSTPFIIHLRGWAHFIHYPFTNRFSTLASKNCGTIHIGQLQCAAQKLLHRPSMARRGAFKRITRNSPDPKGFERMKIIRRCELPASLLEHVAKGLWGFNGMNIKKLLHRPSTARRGTFSSKKSFCGLPTFLKKMWLQHARYQFLGSPAHILYLSRGI